MVKSGRYCIDTVHGVGSEVYSAARLGRRGIGFELKPTYFRQSVKNLEAVDADIVHEPTLFDTLDREAQAVICWHKRL